MRRHKKLLIKSAIVFATIILLQGIDSYGSITYAFHEKPIVDVIEYKIVKGSYHGHLKTPVLDGLINKKLEKKLNNKYLKENKMIYNEFLEIIKEDRGAPLSIESDYFIKTDTDNLLVIGRYVTYIAASSSTIIKYDTIDRKNGILITLPSLFKDDIYINIINNYIKNKMIEKNKDGYFYFVDDFKGINDKQQFYINGEGKLVISFDDYEVAPGAMGIVEFIIPTEILMDSLVSNQYIY
jgi:hypothetical protein